MTFYITFQDRHPPDIQMKSMQPWSLQAEEQTSLKSWSLDLQWRNSKTSTNT